MQICHDRTAIDLWDTHVTSWPRNVLKWILCRNHMGPGARVLEVRAEESGFAGLACELGIDVTTRSPFQIELDRTTARVADSFLWDLVIVRDHPLVHLPLHTPAALECTSGLISGLRPGGSLIITVSTSPDELVHGQRCWATHLGQFDGCVESRTFRTDQRGWRPWRRSVGSSVWQMVALDRVRPAIDTLSLPARKAIESGRDWRCECLRTTDSSLPIVRAA